MMEPMATDALTAVADELYDLVPDEFTAARNARAKAAKDDDRELSDRITQLKKPSPAAWIVNRLVREHAAQVDELFDLGAELREAQAHGDGRALTTLGSQRRKLVSALLALATELADAADRSPSRAVLDEVEQTLIAGTVDEAAEAAVRSGRLVRSLQAVGFEEVDLDGAVAGEASVAGPTKRRPAARGKASGKKPAARKGESDEDREAAERAAEKERDAAARAAREQAEADLRDARDRAEAADRALAEAEDLLHAAEWNADELRDERHDLEARLKELRTEIAAAERDERDAERVRAKAAVAVDRARDDVEAAEAALDRLG
ncbi:hypothetical protein [Agromyces sp. Marseille-P2726]|uniref:hypothetical protein n=1 Tax=Agromyces sp. Marseille-P2726 TaxID=2709132 RepID=UPI00157014D6|nr:hypothetical protein [Agromyces sp. Marseille-P2726]